MKRSKKRQFHCERCASPCEIYKKGKNHRVLVCPRCGVLATNPFSFGKALKGSLLGGLNSLPGGGFLSGAAEGFTPKEQKERAETTLPLRAYPRDSYSTEERVRDALL